MGATARELPFPVLLAAIFGFAKAGFLALMGVIGVLAWDGVSDPWGIGSLIMAALFGIASYMLMHGNRAARIVLAALAVIGGVTAIVFAFIGPASAILPSITTAVLAAIVIWLLYGLRSSKEYFGT